MEIFWPFLIRKNEKMGCCKPGIKYTLYPVHTALRPYDHAYHPDLKTLSNRCTIAVKIFQFCKRLNHDCTAMLLRQKRCWLDATTITDENTNTNADQAVFFFGMVADGAAFLLRPQRSHHDATTLLVRQWRPHCDFIPPIVSMLIVGDDPATTPATLILNMYKIRVGTTCSFPT